MLEVDEVRDRRFARQVDWDFSTKYRVVDGLVGFAAGYVRCGKSTRASKYLSVNAVTFSISVASHSTPGSLMTKSSIISFRAISAGPARRRFRL
jgi:hypothetical protein